ncbi:MAG: hypothetical protein AB8H79_05350 [Myxococcota bacterium]
MLTSDDGAAQAQLSMGGRLRSAQGCGTLRRIWPSTPIVQMRAGSEHLSGEEVPYDWWTTVHIRSQAVLGVPSPSAARAGFALGTAVCSLVASGHVWAVVHDQRHWSVDDSGRSQEMQPAAGGIQVARTQQSSRESDLEGLLLQALGDELQPLEHVVGRLGVGVNEALRHARGRPDPRCANAWLQSIDRWPAMTARLVQECLVGLGGLSVPADLGRSSFTVPKMPEGWR